MNHTLTRFTDDSIRVTSSDQKPGSVHLPTGSPLPSWGWGGSALYQITAPGDFVTQYMKKFQQATVEQAILAWFAGLVHAAADEQGGTLCKGAPAQAGAKNLRVTCPDCALLLPKVTTTEEGPRLWRTLLVLERATSNVVRFRISSWESRTAVSWDRAQIPPPILKLIDEGQRRFYARVNISAQAAADLRITDWEIPSECLFVAP